LGYEPPSGDGQISSGLSGGQSTGAGGHHKNFVKIRKFLLMKKTAVIFDFDGVIGDTLKETKNIVVSLYEESNHRKINPKDVEKLINNNVKEVIKKLNLQTKEIPAFQERVRFELSKKINKIKIFKGIRGTLLSLKKDRYTLGILSSNSRENLHFILKNNGLDFFDFIYSGYNLFSKGKALASLIEKEDLISEKTIYIGDEERDIQAAKENKVISIAVSWGYVKILKKANPDYFADKPKDLLKIIKKLGLKKNTFTRI
jgi:phosphoglycolate phosphatase